MLESYDDNNKLQFNTDTFLFFLRTSGQTTVVDGSGGIKYINIPTTDNFPNAIVALSPPDGGAYCVAWSNRNSNQRVFQTTAAVGTVVDYYVFEPSSNIPSTGYMEIRNASNQVCFTANQYSLWGRSVINANTSETFTASGRKLAVAPLSYLGLNRYYDEVEETGPGGSTTWTYSHDIIGYGFSLSNGRQTAQASNVTIVSERVNMPTVPSANAYDRGGIMFVIDVTGSPVGFTGF